MEPAVAPDAVVFVLGRCGKLQEGKRNRPMAKQDDNYPMERFGTHVTLIAPITTQAGACAIMMCVLLGPPKRRDPSLETHVSARATCACSCWHHACPDAWREHRCSRAASSVPDFNSANLTASH
jgi:hypothetical protein